MKKIYWQWLLNIEGIGNKKITQLLNIFSCPEEIYNADFRELSKVKSLNKKDIENITNNKDLSMIKKQIAYMKSKDIRMILQEDDEFPDKLKEIENPPRCLYVKGKMLQKDVPCVAIVGARDCSPYGEMVAKDFASKLASAGVIVVSGLATGIDGFAHAGVLDSFGSTYAVLGCSIDTCYPASHLNMYMEIPKRGALISEYPPGTKGNPAFFPMRNRIISGISDAIVVIEAKERSGSLITASQGLEQGKTIFAVPGRTYDVMSQGCNKLIKEGAYLATTAEDILENLEIEKKIYTINKIKTKYMLEKEEKMVYSILGLEPIHMNEVVKKTGLCANIVVSALATLKMYECAKEVAPGYYILATV